MVDMEEVSSFVNKFTSLWRSGRNASLLFESQAGQAYVTIRLGLGAHPVNIQNDFHKHKSPEPKRKKASPSRLRRRARRAAASGAAESVANNEVENTQDSSKMEATCTKEAEKVSVDDEVADDANMMNTEHPCGCCNFTSKWSNGLLIHRSTMHELSTGKPKREEDQKVEDLTQEYWKTGNLVSNLQVYVNALLDVEKATVDDAIKETEERKLEELWNEMQSLKSDLFPP